MTRPSEILREAKSYLETVPFWPKVCSHSNGPDAHAAFGAVAAAAGMDRDGLIAIRILLDVDYSIVYRFMWWPEERTPQGLIDVFDRAIEVAVEAENP